MPQIPQIGIRLIHAKLGHETKNARLDIKQPQAELNMRQSSAKLTIRQPQGELKIDQSKLWDALAIGGHLETMHRIVEQSRNIAMQGIARIVEEGNRLAKIHLGGNPIADNAFDWRVHHGQFNFAGYASLHNVDISYTAKKPEIRVEEGGVRLNPKINKPIYTYHPGKVYFEMIQYPGVEITPPTIDMKI